MQWGGPLRSTTSPKLGAHIAEIVIPEPLRPIADANKVKKTSNVDGSSENSDKTRKDPKLWFPDSAMSDQPIKEALHGNPPNLPMKPLPQDWILGRKSLEKMNLISWLIDGCFINDTGAPRVSQDSAIPKCSFKSDVSSEAAPEFQTFDGFFNNPFKVDLGAVGKSN
jgi:hypothetical protein